jgi:hypothetical protein
MTAIFQPNNEGRRYPRIILNFLQSTGYHILKDIIFPLTLSNQDQVIYIYIHIHTHTV